MKAKILLTVLCITLAALKSSGQDTVRHSIAIPDILFRESRIYSAHANGSPIMCGVSVNRMSVMLHPLQHSQEQSITNRINQYLKQHGYNEIIDIYRVRLRTLSPDADTNYMYAHLFINIKTNETGSYRQILITGSESGSDTITVNQSNRMLDTYPEMSGNSVLTRTYTQDSGAYYFDDITYLDALGYPEQIINAGASPEGTSIVSAVAYDNKGRSVKSFLPYVSTNITFQRDYNHLQKQKQYYEGEYGATEAEYAFVQKEYEPSVPGRIVREYNAGSIFHTGQGKYRNYSYHTNTENEVFILNVNSETSALTVAGFYDAGELNKNTLTNEDGQTTVIFTDKDNNTVLLRKTDSARNNDTYFAYNDYGQQCWVVSPKGSERLANSATYPANSDLAALYCYVYKYDGRGNMIERQMPDREIEYMVYDKGGRMVMMQDGNMRQNSRWIYNVYDDLDNITETNLITATVTREDAQSMFSDESYRNDYGSLCLENRILTPFPVTGFTDMNTHYPLLQARYYGGIYFNNIPPNPLPGVVWVWSNPEYLDFEPVDSICTYSDLNTDNIKGFKAYERIRVLDSSSRYVERAFYYDYWGRVIQTVEKNGLGGISRYSIKYSFAGNILAASEQHSRAVGNAESAKKDTTRVNVEKFAKYSYDHRGRLKNEAVTLNGSITATARYEYSELGQLHKTVYNNTVSESMKYSMQGWLVEKQANAVTAGIFQQKNTIFGMQLKYYDMQTRRTKPSYTGNIAEWTWRHGRDTAHTYAFAYDRLNRLTDSKHYEGAGNTPDNRYTEQGITYDPNGNMLGIKRYNAAGIDENSGVHYVYTGNRLTAKRRGMLAINDPLYGYDANGNMNADLQKGITIEYSLLNLPYRIMKGDTLKATYTYLADGTKLAVADSAGNGFEYLGSLVYKINNSARTLESTGFSGGRIYATSAGYTVRYFITDHLGSVRAVADQNGNIIEQNSYYPFGKRWDTPDMPLAGNRYAFGGKERQTAGNTGWLDFYARMYDSHTGRWLAQDPMQEMYYGWSQYAYCANNPVNYIDPWGMQWKETDNGYTTSDPDDIAALFEWLSGVMTNLSNSEGSSGGGGSGFVTWFVNFLTGYNTYTSGYDQIPESVIVGKRPENAYKYMSINRNGEQVTEPITGFWGHVGYYLLEIGTTYTDKGITYKVNTKGQITGRRPIGGTVPIPAGGIKALKGIKQLNKLVKTGKALQTGGHTLNNSTLKALGLTKQQGNRAIEALKKAEGILPNQHGKIMSNGDYILNGIFRGNLYDYLP